VLQASSQRPLVSTGSNPFRASLNWQRQYVLINILDELVEIQLSIKKGGKRKPRLPPFASNNLL
jgi:hypothetical protein